MEIKDNAPDLYADLRGAVISTVHDIMNEEITRLRALVRHVVEEEIEARKKDIARDVMAEIARQMRMQAGATTRA
jgi:hypothetical protein